MASFGVGNAAQELCEAIRQRNKFVKFNAARSLGTVLIEACRLDRRLTGTIAGWDGKKSGNGMLGINKTYQIELKYRENVVSDVNKVIVDDGSWKPTDLLEHGELPDAIQIVTQDIVGLRRRADEDLNSLDGSTSGIKGFNYTWTEDDLDGYCCLWIIVQYVMDKNTFHMYQTMANREAERVARRFFGPVNIPPLIKVYLAFSYIQQTCLYDQAAADYIEKHHEISPQNPWVSFAYGPLVKKMGVCAGIAAAFKAFMDTFGIPCRIINGNLIASGKMLGHSWNLIRLNEQYYHVDCTMGINGDGVYIGCFVKDDIEMSETHVWDNSKYPACTSRVLSFDNVEDYINSHMDKLIAEGVEETYLCPDDIRE